MHLNIYDYPYGRYPKAIFSSPLFRHISVEARALMILILDRFELSEINSDRFSDENGRVYVIYTVEEICEIFGCCSEKTIRLFRELEKHGMIARYRKNRLTPYRIYLTDKFCDTVKSEVTNSEKPKSRVQRSRSHEFGNSEDIYNNYNNNNTINNNSSTLVTDEEIKEQIEFDCLYCEENEGMLNEIIMIISDVLNGTSPTVRVGRDDMPRELVVRRFRMLDGTDVANVIWQIKRNKTKITNIKSYLIMLLYNEHETSECEAAALFALHNA